MEWQPGSDDVSVPETKILDWKSGTRPPAMVFGIGSSTVLHKQNQRTIENEAKELGAALVRAYSEIEDPSERGFRPLVREYTRYRSFHSLVYCV